MTDKRMAYGVTFFVRSLILLCFFYSSSYFAQDTISLKDVEISSSKIQLSQIGKKTEAIDSTVKEQFKNNSIAEVLGYNSSVFIKSYGPGGLATTGFRGGNASQTALLWNGFNLQNAMLGQADLALMPAVLFEDIGIEYGGSSSAWGSGAMVGSIHLNNKLNFDKGLVSKLNFGAGSYGSLNGSAAVLVSQKRFVSSTKIYINNSQNNFRYRDTLDKENRNKRQKDSEYYFKGLMQEFRFLLNPKQIVSVNAWLTTNQRHLPVYNAGYKSKTYQDDDAIRLTANWKYIGKQFNSVIRGGYFIDRIDYIDSIRSIFSKSKTNTFMFENENYFNLHKNHQLNVAVNVLSSIAFTENYTSSKTLSRASLLLGNKFTFLKEKLVVYVSARAEYFSVGSLPVTGNVSAEYKLLRHINAKINAAKVYRQPTLNELYWTPGGNANLKPEQGYTYEGELNYSRKIGNLSFFVSASVYSRVVNNWILWVPGANGNPSPVNIQSVWSRGTETSWKINYRKNKWRVGTGIITAYVLSTVQANTQENDNSLNKQLIYTPRYTVNGHVSMGYMNTDLIFYQQYSGYRFTTSDNLNWLTPYSVSSLRLNHKLDLTDIVVTLFGACNNVFNTNYTVMAGKPMPLRNYEFGLSIQTKPIKRNKST